MLQAREGSVHGLVKDAHSRLLEIAANKKAYKGLLTDLTVQVGLPPPSLPTKTGSVALAFMWGDMDARRV